MGDVMLPSAPSTSEVLGEECEAKDPVAYRGTENENTEFFFGMTVE